MNEVLLFNRATTGFWHNDLININYKVKSYSCNRIPNIPLERNLMSGISRKPQWIICLREIENYQENIQNFQQYQLTRVLKSHKCLHIKLTKFWKNMKCNEMFRKKCTAVLVRGIWICEIEEKKIKSCWITRELFSSSYIVLKSVMFLKAPTSIV